MVLDTHVLLWWTTAPERLSARARRAMEHALRRGPLTASTISLFEIVTAGRRGRLQLTISTAEWLAELPRILDLRLEPVTTEIAQAAGALADTIPGDPADRLIVATARALNARLVTADQRLRRSGLVDTVW